MSEGVSPAFYNTLNENITGLDTKTDALETKTVSISENGKIANFETLKQDGHGVLDDSYIPRQESVMMQIAATAAGNVSRATGINEQARIPFGNTRVAQSFNSFTISNGLFTANRNIKVLVGGYLVGNITTGTDGLIEFKIRKNGTEYNRSIHRFPTGQFFTIPINAIISLNAGETVDMAYQWDGAKTTLLYYASAITITELF